MPPIAAPSRRRLSRLRPTMADIAREAGVARSTVSAILGNHDYCYASQAVRRRVVDAAKRLGYTPNYLARGLAGKRTQCIGLVMGSIKGPPVNMSKIQNIELAAWEKGYRFMVGNSAGNAERQREYIRMYLSQRADGVIIQQLEQDNVDLVDQLIDEGFPVVTIDTPVVSRAPGVTFDRQGAGYLQTRHVIAQGRRRIAFLIGGGGQYFDQQKCIGFRRALDEAGIGDDEATFVYSPRWLPSESPATGAKLLQAANDMGRAFDAVITTSDMLAMGAMQALLNEGKRVPDDVAVVGFNDSPVAAHLPVPLTTIVHTGEAGTVAFDLLYEQITQSDETSARHVLLPASLVVRQSTVGDSADATPAVGTIIHEGDL